MTMIEAAAERIALAIKRANPEETVSVAVMKFSLIMVIGTGSALFFSFLISGLLGSFIDTLITLLAFVVLRFFSGGFHFKTAEKCTLSSIIGAVSIPYIPLSHLGNIMLLTTSVIIVIWLAPIGKNQSRIFKQQHNKLLKVISVVIVLSNFYIQSNVITLAFFVQSLTLVFLLKGGERNEENQRC